MAAGDSLHRSAARYLRDGEPIQAVFRASTMGPAGRKILFAFTPAVIVIYLLRFLIKDPALQLVVILIAVAALLGIAASILRWRIIVATPDRILVLKTSLFGGSARGIRTELPRSTKFGPASGNWYDTRIGSERLSVPSRFFRAVDEADAAAGYWNPRRT